MSNRLGGRQSTAYTGTNANQPPNWTFSNKDPNQYDIQNVSVGDMWHNSANEKVWVLVSLAGDMNSKGSLATWIEFGGSNIAQSFVTDSGTASGISGLINIKANTAATHAGSSVSFSGSGNTIQLNVTDASDNTLIGATAGNTTLTGTENSALGRFVLENLTSGNDNCAIGFLALNSLTSGSNCIGIGSQSLSQLINGNNTIGVGFQAGKNYTTNESSNIVIGSLGIVAESNTLRLGTNGNGTAQQNRCFIAGIDGVNVGSTATIVTENANQLGTAVITAGSGITVTPGANSITIARSGSVSPVSFSAYKTTDSTNVTGDGTGYIVIFDTEEFDSGSNYNTTTGEFTAPVAGNYQFNATIDFISAAAANSISINFVVNGAPRLVSRVGGDATSSVGGQLNISASILASLDIGQTCYVLVTAGGTTKTIGVAGLVTPPGVTLFSGFLVS